MVVSPLGEIVDTESDDGDRGTARPGEGGVDMGGASFVGNVVCLLEREREGTGEGEGGREQEREREGAEEAEQRKCQRRNREPTVS